MQTQLTKFFIVLDFYLDYCLIRKSRVGSSCIIQVEVRIGSRIVRRDMP